MIFFTVHLFGTKH